jgi:excisionase family DNA binding protein
MDRPAPLAPGFIERRAQPRAPRRRWDDQPPAPPLPATQVVLTVKQVADLLGMTVKAVYHRAERGQIPGKFYVGKSLRFRRAELLRSIAEGRGLSPTRSR